MLVNIIQKISDKFYIRGVPYLLYKLRNRFKNPSGIYFDPDQIKVSIEYDNYFQYNIIWGYYEPNVRELFIKYLAAGNTVVDVGANIGYLSCLAAKYVGASGKIIAIEPNPKAIRFIKENVEINNFKNIIIVPKAASNAEGEILLNVGDEIGFSTLVEKPDFMEVKEKIPVQMDRVDNILKEHKIDLNSVALVKMDVEGHEYAALEGMKELIASRKAKFIVESNYSTLKFYGKSIIDIAHIFFFPHQYKIYWMNSKDKISFLKKKVRLDEITPDNIRQYEKLNGDFIAIP